MKRLEESPLLIPRQWGGWIALSGRQDALRIGVLADTEEEARDLFRASRAEWGTILDTTLQRASPTSSATASAADSP